MASPDRCYACFRPQAACFCAAIPKIENRTEVLILQHRRERFHPFNTARIVHKSLCNSLLLADHTSRLATRLRLKPGAGLLYPGPAALLLEDLPVDQHPQQLVILDGTWHHAKTLLREIPALQRLPRYRLAPAAPSRYRIRREPCDTALSTVEATVAALRILEPETAGFDRLLGAFDTMVEDQLAHPNDARVSRFQTRRNRTFKNIPRALAGDLKHVVAAYGESPAGKCGCQRTSSPPIVWVAQRLGTGETFACKLIPPGPLDDVFLGHLALQRHDFAAALSLEEARQQWARFQRPTDIIAVLQPGTARLFSHLAQGDNDCLVLKSVDLETLTDPSRWNDGAAFDGAAMLPNSGRAGQRLAQAVAVIRHLNSLSSPESEFSIHHHQPWVVGKVIGS